MGNAYEYKTLWYARFQIYSFSLWQLGSTYVTIYGWVGINAKFLTKP